MFRVNFNVQTARRKWLFRPRRCGQSAMVIALALGALSGAAPTPAAARERPLFTDPFSGPLEELFQPPRRRSRRAAPPVPAVEVAVPLPKPRPADAPQTPAPQVATQTAPPPASEPEEATTAAAAVPLPEPRPPQADAPASPAQESPSRATLPPPAPPEPAPPSACRLALTEEIAIAPSIPDISGPGACGGTDLVRLEAVVLPDKGRVALRPAGVMRCTMASAVADWIRSDMAPLATSLGTTLAELDNFDSFECRGRNRVAGAKLSEHGKANALDVRGLKFANGVTLSLTDRAASREAREKTLHSVCARFTTVLGPGSDGYHEDHIHLDLAERRSGYRICQWNLYDPLPVVAPLLPAERPEGAPPREVAETRPDAKPDADVSAQEASPPVPLSPPVTSARRGTQNDATVAARPTPEKPRNARSQAAKPETVPLPTPSPVRTARRGEASEAGEAPPRKRKAKRRRATDLPPPFEWFR